MIVGIDDSGSFKDEDMGLFAAVYIRPKKYEKLKKIFESWENDLPDKCKKDGEVKGWLLSDEQLAHFAENILLNNNVHGTKHHVFATPLVDFNIETIEYQRKRNVRDFDSKCWTSSAKILSSDSEISAFARKYEINF